MSSFFKFEDPPLPLTHHLYVGLFYSIHRQVVKDLLILFIGDTYFFKGTRVWKFKNQNLEVGYPKQIKNEFPGIPDDMNAASVFGGNGEMYFYKV